MGFTPSKTISDMWIRDRGDHCELIATHVDGPLVWSRDVTTITVEFCDNDDDAIVTPALLMILGKLTGHQATECLKPQLVAGMGW